MRFTKLALIAAAALCLVPSCARATRDVSTDPSVRAQKGRDSFADEAKSNADRMFDEGKSRYSVAQQMKISFAAATQNRHDEEIILVHEPGPQRAISSAGWSRPGRRWCTTKRSNARQT